MASLTNLFIILPLAAASYLIWNNGGFPKCMGWTYGVTMVAEIFFFLYLLYTMYYAKYRYLEEHRQRPEPDSELGGRGSGSGGGCCSYISCSDYDV